MGWISINDPFCGHSCFDGVMVTQEKPSYPTGYIMLDHVVEAVKEAHEAPWHAKEAFGTPNGPNDPFCGHLWLLMASWSPGTLGDGPRA